MNERGAIRRRGILAILLASVVLVSGCTAVIGPPDPGTANTIHGHLSNPTLVPTPQAAPVMMFAFILPTSKGERTRLIVRPIPSGKLPPQLLADPSFGVMGHPTTPADVLAYPGLYIEVTDGQNRIVYLARMIDPRVVVGEDFAGDAVLPVARTGTVAGRYPLVPGGHLSFFAIEKDPGGPGNSVGRVYFTLLLNQPKPKNYSVVAQ